MGLRIFLLAMVFVLSTGTTADADQAQRLQRIEAAFAGWLAQNRADGVVSVRRKGRELAVFSMGIPANQTVELASLSKAITGICAYALTRAGVLSFGDRFSARLGRGPDVTLAALLTHTSGLRPDSTQRMMPRRLNAKGGGHLGETVLNTVERRKPARAGKYFYNNENYALAALMIENATGSEYSRACQSRALSPAGVKGQRARRSGGFLPWGGWAMTVSDYSKWHAHWFGSALPTAQHPKSMPHVHNGGGWHYGLGTNFRAAGGRNNFWHFGAYCMGNRFQLGSYAVTWGGDWTIVAAYDRCVNDASMGALDAAMIEAVFGPLD